MKTATGTLPLSFSVLPQYLGESFAVKFVSKETQADELENLKVEVELMRMVDNNDHGRFYFLYWLLFVDFP